MFIEPVQPFEQSMTSGYQPMDATVNSYTGNVSHYPSINNFIPSSTINNSYQVSSPHGKMRETMVN